jgi:hypothetical protein
LRCSLRPTYWAERNSLEKIKKNFFIIK